MSDTIHATAIITPLREIPPTVKRDLGLPDCAIYFKDETGAVGGSKSRVARSLLDEGQRAGFIDATTEVQIPSSGSTGLALADETRRRGLRLQVFLPATTAPAKMAALEQYPHVRIVRVDGTSEDARESADAYVQAAARRGERVWLADQYGDRAAVLAHALTTAPELLLQTNGRLTHVVAGVGTASTSTGLALTLRPLGVDVVGVQPASARHALTGLKYFPALPKRLVPRNAELHRLTAVEYIADEAALEMTRRLIANGFLFGPSTGAVVCAAARRFAHLNTEACVVLLAHDPAHYYPELLKEAHHA